MAILHILEYPDPRLRTTAEPVKLVDDSVRTLIADMLGFVLGTDFEVYPCESRAQAVDLLRQLPQAPQLALVESRHGCTVLSRIREKRLELLSDDFVEKRLLRLVALVSGHGAPGLDRRGGRRSEA